MVSIHSQFYRTPFIEIFSVAIAGRLYRPKEWRGVLIDLYLFGFRNLARTYCFFADLSFVGNLQLGSVHLDCCSIFCPGLCGHSQNVVRNAVCMNMEFYANFRGWNFSNKFVLFNSRWNRTRGKSSLLGKLRLKWAFFRNHRLLHRLILFHVFFISLIVLLFYTNI